MMTVDQFFTDYIHVWEDGSSTDPVKTLSLDPDDNGNWTGGTCGQGTLVGSNHGVTAAALALHLDCAPAAITKAQMGALTLDEAAQIGKQNYYLGTGLDTLPWDPVIASVTDFGWGAGPGTGKRQLQKMIAVGDDGSIGDQTRKAYAEFIASHGIEDAALRWQTQRNTFYQAIVNARPVNAKYLKGWTNRSAYFAPGGAWWTMFTA